jgi:hypothetical protein
VRTLKIIFFALIGLFLIETAQAQSREEVYPDKGDPAKAVQLYPNPATDFLTVRFEQPKAKHVKLAMSSILGNSLDLDVETIDEYEVKIKVRDLPSGYYFLVIHDDQSQSKSMHKFLKR